MTLGERGKEWRKGQIAMEYLITYGWALVIIAVIMAMLYSTIFKPEFYIAEACNMAPGLECNPQTTQLKGAETPEGAYLSLMLTNLMTYDITFNSLEFTTTDLAAPGEMTYTISCIPSCSACSTDCESRGGWYVGTPGIAKGNSSLIEVLFKGDKPVPGKLYRIKFVLNYTISETGTKHRTAGIINVRGS